MPLYRFSNRILYTIFRINRPSYSQRFTNMHRSTNPLYPLRFIAALTVVLYHYTPLSIRPQLSFITRNGNEAVNFFFFISGFVMILANISFLRSEKGTFSKWDFYIKRIARIYPLYLLAILLLTFFHYFIKHIDTDTVKYRIIFESIGIQRWLYKGSFNYPGWTISSEFFFYMLFPFTILLMKKNYSLYTKIVCAYFLITLLVSGILINVENHEGISTTIKKVAQILYLHPVFKFSIFLVGTLCGKVYVENKITFFQKTSNSIFCVLISFTIIYFTKQLMPIDQYLLNGGILSVVYFVMILAITSFDKNKYTFFTNKYVILSGEISYGIYILQYPVFKYYTTFIQQITTVLSLINFILVLIVISAISYYTLELPAKSFILNLYKRKKLNVVTTPV